MYMEGEAHRLAPNGSVRYEIRLIYRIEWRVVLYGSKLQGALRAVYGTSGLDISRV